MGSSLPTRCWNARAGIPPSTAANSWRCSTNWVLSQMARSVAPSSMDCRCLKKSGTPKYRSVFKVGKHQGRPGVALHQGNTSPSHWCSTRMSSIVMLLIKSIIEPIAERGARRPIFIIR